MGALVLRRLSTVLAFLIVIVPAYAESPAEALKRIGLIGTWSLDCARKIIDPCQAGSTVNMSWREQTLKSATDCPERVEYSISSSGDPLRTISSPTPQGGAPSVWVYLITEASRVGTNKIRLRWSLTPTLAYGGRQAPATSPVWNPEPREEFEIVDQMLGNKTRAMEAHTVDGRKIYIKDGFYYEPVMPYSTSDPKWQSSGIPTLVAEQCLKTE